MARDLISAAREAARGAAEEGFTDADAVAQHVMDSLWAEFEPTEGADMIRFVAGEAAGEVA